MQHATCNTDADAIKQCNISFKSSSSSENRGNRTSTTKMSTSSRKWETSTPPVSPKKGRRVRDKLEQSPTSRASCQRCGEKIMKGQNRVGIQGKIETPQGYEVWSMRYYHDGCVTEGTKRSLHLEPPAPKASKKAKTNNGASPRQSITLKPRVRKQLERDLRELRCLFAQTQECEEYKIFQNRSLQELVQKLPTNNIELQQCWGIKGKRCQQYGNSILHIINSYLQQHHLNRQRPMSTNNNPRSPSANRQAKKNKAASNSASKSHDNSDDDIEIGPALSVEEIVAHRVREAEARGEVFEIL